MFYIQLSRYWRVWMCVCVRASDTGIRPQTAIEAEIKLWFCFGRKTNIKTLFDFVFFSQWPSENGSHSRTRHANGRKSSNICKLGSWRRNDFTPKNMWQHWLGRIESACVYCNHLAGPCHVNAMTKDEREAGLSGGETWREIDAECLGGRLKGKKKKKKRPRSLPARVITALTASCAPARGPIKAPASPPISERPGTFAWSHSEGVESLLEGLSRVSPTKVWSFNSWGLKVMLHFYIDFFNDIRMIS